MKFEKNKITTLTATGLPLLLVIGLLIGWAVTRIEYTNRLNDIQNELILTQESLNQYIDAFELLEANLQYQCEINENLEMDLAESMATVANLKAEQYEIIYMGDFKVTYYCNELEPHICGGNGVTASGQETVVGITAAADWSILPQGSLVYIEEVGFREIQDVGGSVVGNHIDVLVETHTDAIDRGTHFESVWLLIKKDS